MKRKSIFAPFFKYSPPSLLTRMALQVGVTVTPQRNYDPALGVEPECLTPVNFAEVNGPLCAARKDVIQLALVEPIVGGGVNRLRFQNDQRES